MCHPTHQISHAKQFYTSPGTPWNLYPAVPIASARFPLAERNVKNRPQVNPTPHNFTGPNMELTGYLFKLKLNLIAALSQISGVHR